MSRKITISASPPLVALRDEAEAMGVSFPALLTADIVRYRKMAIAAAPTLDPWERGAISLLLAEIEAHGILSGDDSLPSAARIAAMVEEWIDDAAADDALRAERLRRKVEALTPLAIAGLLLRERPGHLRREP